MIHTRTKIAVLMGSALLLASLSAGGIFLYKLAMQKTAYHTLRTEEAAQAARNEALAALVETLAATEDDRAVLATRFITESDVIELLALIETLARESGVLLATENLTVEPGDTQFEYLLATVSVEGKYANVLRMLELLEYLPYETHVQTINLERSQNDWRGVFGVRILKLKSV